MCRIWVFDSCYIVAGQSMLLMPHRLESTPLLDDKCRTPVYANWLSGVRCRRWRAPACGDCRNCRTTLAYATVVHVHI